MSPKIRAIIFWLMVVLFLVFAPIVILYALDYSYDWQNKKLVQNGAFYFQAEPKNASIFINGKYKKTAPRLVKKMPPRNYVVEIKKDGYNTWKKELTIKAGLVTELKYILLIKQSPELEISAENIKSLKDIFIEPENSKKQEIKKLVNSSLKLKNYETILSKNQYAAVIDNSTTSQKTEKTVSHKRQLYLLDEEKNFNLLAEGVISAQFSKDSKKLLWHTENEIWIYWLENDYIQPPREADEKVFITRFSEKIGQAVWYEGDERHIIFTIGNTVKIIEIDDRDQKNIMDILTLKNPQIFSKNKTLYILSENKLYSARISENEIF